MMEFLIVHAYSEDVRSSDAELYMWLDARLLHEYSTSQIF